MMRITRVDRAITNCDTAAIVLHNSAFDCTVGLSLFNAVPLPCSGCVAVGANQLTLCNFIQNLLPPSGFQDTIYICGFIVIYVVVLHNVEGVELAAISAWGGLFQVTNYLALCPMPSK